MLILVPNPTTLLQINLKSQLIFLFVPYFSSGWHFYSWGVTLTLQYDTAFIKLIWDVFGVKLKSPIENIKLFSF